MTCESPCLRCSYFCFGNEAASKVESKKVISGTCTERIAGQTSIALKPLRVILELSAVLWYPAPPPATVPMNESAIELQTQLRLNMCVQVKL